MKMVKLASCLNSPIITLASGLCFLINQDNATKVMCNRTVTNHVEYNAVDNSNSASVIVDLETAKIKSLSKKILTELNHMNHV